MPAGAGVERAARACLRLGKEKTMTTERRPVAENEDLLDVLACEIDARPKDAPSFADLQSAILGVAREEGAVRVEFDPARRDDVRRLVEAERLCCAGIGWDLREGPGLTLRIVAAPGQLDVFEGFLGGTG